MGNLVKNGISYTGGSGASSYNELNDKPSINGTTISGNKTSSDLGIATEITELDDVAITTPSDNDVLKYNSTSGKWENGQGGGGAVSELTDVELDSLQNGQVLKWNSTDEVWENADESGGGGHTIEDVDGTDLTQRDTLQFGEGLLAEDDSTNEKTVVALDPMPSEDIDEVVDIYPTAGELVSIINAFNRGDIYSTDEKMIGQWCDGKPLYQKVINLGNLPNNTSKSVAHNVSNVEAIFIKDGFAKTATDDFNTLPYLRIDNSNYGIEISVNLTNVTIKTYADRSAWIGYVIVQYTKTTDTAISIGEETEYSTDEKVIGTWIDGKPLYQKTIAGTATTYTDATKRRTFELLSIPNISSIADVRLIYDLNDWGTPMTGVTIGADGVMQFGWYGNVASNIAKVFLQDTTKSITSVQYVCTIQYTKTTT